MNTSSYSDYIVFVDESGDHSLESINARYPLFVLSFCVFRKRCYIDDITPALRALKFETFGHEIVILHEQEIRKREGAFKMLAREERESFLSQLTELISRTEFTLIPIVIDKRAWHEQGLDPVHVYHYAMQLGLQALYVYLQMQQQQAFLTHVIFEARGHKENSELELEFRRVCNGENSLQYTLPFKIVIADKKTNSEGLQFADLVARPIGLSVLRPDQPNRAFAVLEEKIFHSQGYVYPLKAKGLKVILEAQTPVG